MTVGELLASLQLLPKDALVVYHGTSEIDGEPWVDTVSLPVACPVIKRTIAAGTFVGQYSVEDAKEDNATDIAYDISGWKP